MALYTGETLSLSPHVVTVGRRILITDVPVSWARWPQARYTAQSINGPAFRCLSRIASAFVSTRSIRLGANPAAGGVKQIATESVPCLFNTSVDRHWTEGLAKQCRASRSPVPRPAWPSDQPALWSRQYDNALRFNVHRPRVRWALSQRSSREQ